MVEFTLPKNSRVTEGKVWPPTPAGARNLREYRIYRYDPDTGGNPRFDNYSVDMDDCGPMVLDALICIKNEIDPTLDLPPLLPRRHLRLVRDEYRRGFTLACTKLATILRRHHCFSAAPSGGREGFGPRPLFYAQHRSIEPWLKTTTPAPHDRVAADEAERGAKSSTGFMSASSAPAARRRARPIGGTARNIWGRRCCCRPIGGLIDSRDEAQEGSGSTISRIRSSSIAATRL